MPNLASVLKDEIRRLARSEIRKELSDIQKRSAQHRRDIAELKRQITDQQRKLNYFEKQEQKRIADTPEQAPEGARFNRKGLISHRKRLGISAADYARLVGVSPLTIYNWEHGKTRPRDAQLAKLVEVRDLGVREAKQRLELLNGE